MVRLGSVEKEKTEVDKEYAERVSRVKKSARGKKYTDLTKEEWEILFSDDANNISAVCQHNGIICDVEKTPKWKHGHLTGSKILPNSMKAKPVK